MKWIFLALTLMAKVHCSTDMVIFSFDRAMQLDLLLRSIDAKASHLSHISIIKRTSSERHARAYEQLAKDWSHLPLTFIDQKQGEFREVVLKELQKSKADAVVFAVDDMVLTKRVDFKRCEGALKSCPRAIAFYLRLGKNITKNFQNESLVPPVSHITRDLCRFSFHQSQAYWDYPHTVDMTLFRKDELFDLLSSVSFAAPNTMEVALGSAMQEKARVNRAYRNRGLGLCFAESKAFNVPANVVRKEDGAPSFGTISILDFLVLFEKGMRVDYSDLDGYQNKCPHENFSFKFKKYRERL